MPADTLNSLFTLLDAEEDDFPALIKRFGIDPAKDLQNCDLSNVDFGTLTADLLDLTGSNIQGANLSRVKCKKIIGALGRLAGMDDPPPGVLDGVILAVSRYQNSDWVTNQIIANFADESAPVLAFYDTSAEQDVLTNTKSLNA